MAKIPDPNSNSNSNATGVILTAADWFEENAEPAFAAALREAGEAVARLKCELADCRTALNEVRGQRRDQETRNSGTAGGYRAEYDAMVREAMTQIFPGGGWTVTRQYDSLNIRIIFYVDFGYVDLGNPVVHSINDPATVRYSFTIDEYTRLSGYHQTVREIIYEHVLRIRSEFIKRIEENPRYSPDEWTITPGPPRARRNAGSSLVTE